MPKAEFVGGPLDGASMRMSLWPAYIGIYTADSRIYHYHAESETDGQPIRMHYSGEDVDDDEDAEDDTDEETE